MRFVRRWDEIALFFVANVFTNSLNSLGVANLPKTLESIQRRDAATAIAQLRTVFYILVVAAGFTGKHTDIIKVNATANIVLSVKESIEARRSAIEEVAEQPVLSGIMLTLKNKLFREKPVEPNIDEEKDQGKCAIERAKKFLAGKRESAMDDVLSGFFQVSVVFFGVPRWQALGHAWMVFLLQAMENTVLNETLNRQQKLEEFGWLSFTAYCSGRIVLKLM